MSSNLITLTVKLASGESFELPNVDEESTVLDVKTSLVERAGVPQERQRLIYKGRILGDDATLKSSGIVSGSSVYLVRSAAPGGGAAPRSPPSATPAAPSPAAQQPSAGFPQPNAGAFPFAFPQGGAGGPGAGMQDMFGAMPSPETMRTMMSSPMFASFLNNPDRLRSVMEMALQANPSMRAMVDSNPELRQALMDPDTLRAAMRMATDPSARQHMGGLEDRTLANIEAMPGGHNALRRMFTQTLEPMMDAAAAAHEQPSRPAQQRPRPQAPGGAMPNPWAAPPAARAPAADPSFNPWAALDPNAGAGGGAPQPSAADLFGGLGGGAGADQQAFINAMLGGAGGAGAGGLLGNLFGGGPQPAHLEYLMNPATGGRRGPLTPEALSAIDRFTEAWNVLAGQNILGPMPAPMTSFLTAVREPPTVEAAVTTAPTAPPVDPEVQYAAQLEQMAGMGFTDRAANIRALRATHGNVSAAVERLLSEM